MGTPNLNKDLNLAVTRRVGTPNRSNHLNLAVPRLTYQARPSLVVT